MNVKPGLDLIKESFQEWQKDGALDLGAALCLLRDLLARPAAADRDRRRRPGLGPRGGPGAARRASCRGSSGEQGGQAIQTMIANAGEARLGRARHDRRRR